MKKIFLSSLALLCCAGLFAQSNTVSGGGTATGTGGSVSFTIGQVAYSTVPSTNNTGYLIQGVQQPSESLIITSTRDFEIDLKAQVYPNPTADQLMLTINNNELKQLNYQIIDLQGKVLRQDRLNNTTTSIDMANLPNGTYFIKVQDKQKQLKTFQVIKNK